MSPKVSVIIPVYNTALYLRECLDSIINQSLKEIEIICVDDGSTDDSLSILREYAERDYRFKILNQSNKHAGVARNTGFQVASGEFLSFLDGDDLFDLDMLKEMYNQAKKDNSDTVICEFYEYNDKTKNCDKRSIIRPTYASKSPFSPKLFINNAFSFSSLNAWTKLFRRKMFIDNDIRFSSTVCCNDVSAVCTAIACSRRISIIKKPFIRYRTNQCKSLSASRNNCPNSFLTAAKDLEQNLKRLGIYEQFKNAYLSRMTASYKWELSLCNDKQKEERKLLAKEFLSDDLYYMVYNERK